MEQNITLSMTIMKPDGTIFTDSTNTWGGLDDQALAWFERVANELNAHWHGSQGAQGKTYSVKLSGKIVGSDGSVRGAPWDGTPVTYPNVPYSAIREANRKVMKYGAELEKIGQQLDKKHANDVHGKK